MFSRSGLLHSARQEEIGAVNRSRDWPHRRIEEAKKRRSEEALSSYANLPEEIAEQQLGGCLNYCAPSDA
jgi:hypothetical protein